MENKQSEWDDSYQNKDNFVFYPHEEVIRFVSKYIRKRIGFDEFQDVDFVPRSKKILDLGCGIGRHVIYAHEMGLDAYGVDLSDCAILFAVDWANQSGVPDAGNRVVQSDIRQLKWEDGFFQAAVSHGVLDSMPFEIARDACVELARVMASDGLFYCDMISGDDSRHAREFGGEETVATSHEEGTIQSYFNVSKIKVMVEGLFDIVECNLIRRENVLQGGFHSRYHVVMRKL